MAREEITRLYSVRRYRIPFFRGRQGRKLADDLRNCPRLDREKLKRLADKERARILASMEDDR